MKSLEGVDAINLISKPAGTTVTIQTGSENDMLAVRVSSTSHYSNLLLNGGPPTGVKPVDVLKLILAGAPTVRDTPPVGINPGSVVVTYPLASPSSIQYLDIETVSR